MVSWTREVLMKNAKKLNISEYVLHLLMIDVDHERKTSVNDDTTFF